MSRRAIAGLIGSATLLGAFALGFLMREAPAAQGGLAVSGGTSVSYPASWAPTAAEPEIPGLKLSDSMAVAPRGGAAGSGLVAGQVRAAQNSAPLPAAFLATLRSPPQGGVVSLGGVDALRYSGLTQIGRPNTLDLYVVPGFATRITIACVAENAESERFRSDCARVAATALVAGVYPLGDIRPHGDYARRLGRAIQRLAATRRLERAALGERGTPTGQAAVAARIAAAYGTAADAVVNAGPSALASAPNDAVTAALRATRQAYLALARAARTIDAGAYAAAGREVTAAEAGVQKALDRLRILGYRPVGSPAAG